MDWYSIRITRAELLQGKTEQLVREVQELFRQIDPDPAVAVYSSELNGEAVALYFTPAAATLAMGIIHRHWGCKSNPVPSTAKLIFGFPAVPISSPSG